MEINFDEVPEWQKHGVGLYWESFEKAGRNPSTGEESVAMRRRVRVDKELPHGAAFSDLVARLMASDIG